jgi:hypothetical protein
MATSFLSPVTSSLSIVYQVYDDDLTADSRGVRVSDLRSRLLCQITMTPPALQETSRNRYLLHIWHSLPQGTLSDRLLRAVSHSSRVLG